MFKWSCRLMEKGKKCVRGYNYVGRLCEGCSHYQDEKINYQPRICISGQEFEDFEQELDDFNDWVTEHQNRELDIWCQVENIKPRFVKTLSGKGGQIRLQGYLILVRNGFIGQTEFDDFFYIHISPNQQDRLRFAVGDRFDARGSFSLDRGRILFKYIRRVEFGSRSGKETWNNSKALVARQTASRFERQYETCLHCPHGALVDVMDREQKGQKVFRELYCFESIQDPQNCYVYAGTALNDCIRE